RPEGLRGRRGVRTPGHSPEGTDERHPGRVHGRRFQARCQDLEGRDHQPRPGQSARRPQGKPQEGPRGRPDAYDYRLRAWDIIFVPTTSMAKADRFMTHLYSFLPRQVFLAFDYELNN